MSPSLASGSSKETDETALPNVDLSKAMRGVHAHRMGENTEDEQSAANYWQGLGFAVEFLERGNDRFSRLPDLRLLRDGNPVAYCEVKTIQQHIRETHILHEEREVEVRVEWSSAPAEERLSTDLVTTIRQLNYENPDHSLLNFVVLVNRDPESAPELLTKLLAKQLPKAKRGIKAKHESWTVEAIQTFRRKVDLCLWVSPAPEKRLAVEACLLFNPALFSFAEEITGQRRDKLISLDPAA
jgi:hypothetical protein